MSLEELYQDIILEHFKHPRCRGVLISADHEATLHNPLCGDEIKLGVKIAGNKLVDIAYEGHGCSISQASASMMAELCKGKTIPEITALVHDFRAAMRGEREDKEMSQLGDAQALLGVRKFVARIKCAVLPWEAVEKCLRDVPVL